MVKIISIEGNIGSGKSTVVHNLEQKLKNNKDYVFLREPVDIWETIKDQYGKTILENFTKIKINIHLLFKQWLCNKKCLYYKKPF